MAESRPFQLGDTVRVRVPEGGCFHCQMFSGCLCGEVGTIISISGWPGHQEQPYYVIGKNWGTVAAASELERVEATQTT